MDLHWNNNGNWLLSGSRDRLVKVFDIRTMKEIHTFRGHKKEAACKYFKTYLNISYGLNHIDLSTFASLRYSLIVNLYEFLHHSYKSFGHLNNNIFQFLSDTFLCFIYVSFGTVECVTTF